MKVLQVLLFLFCAGICEASLSHTQRLPSLCDEPMDTKTSEEANTDDALIAIEPQEDIRLTDQMEIRRVIRASEPEVFLGMNQR